MIRDIAYGFPANSIIGYTPNYKEDYGINPEVVEWLPPNAIEGNWVAGNWDDPNRWTKIGDTDYRASDGTITNNAKEQAMNQSAHPIAALIRTVVAVAIFGPIGGGIWIIFRHRKNTTTSKAFRTKKDE